MNEERGRVIIFATRVIIIIKFGAIFDLSDVSFYVNVYL